MSLRYRIDVLKALKKSGYSTYQLQKDRILSNTSIQKLRKGEILGADGLEKLCKLLHCQPGDIIEYVEDPE